MKKFFVCIVLCELLGTAWSLPPERGILVMAHGGTKRWNGMVNDCVKKARPAYPIRVFFGMGCTKKEADDLQHQIQQLESQGVRSIVVIPLAVSSYSEVYRQWRYLLGLQAQPGFDAKLMAEMMRHTHGEMGAMEAVAPVKPHVSVYFPAALDDDTVVSDILLQRAREMSRKPADETVMIVAHGPNQDPDNQRWLDNLQRIATAMKQRGPFQQVEGATLRDDAPPWVRDHAVQTLRNRVTRLDRQGRRVLVVPLLMAPGGIENKIDEALKGLPYSFNAKTLLPDPKMAEWVRQRSTHPLQETSVPAWRLLSGPNAGSTN